MTEGTTINQLKKLRPGIRQKHTHFSHLEASALTVHLDRPRHKP